MQYSKTKHADKIFQPSGAWDLITVTVNLITGFWVKLFALSSTFLFQTIESFAAQEKQMEVCEVCGAFLIVGDAQSRVDDHLMGKQHMGYAKIKATVEDLKVSISFSY